MKLKRIKKLTILIITVVLVIGLFLSNTLIKSHANFENTKSFNIIQGKIPNKNEGDIQFAVLVDGNATEEIPKKDSGYHFTSAECTNGANLTFNSVNWTVNVNNLTKAKTLCILKFETGELTFNYGDGSLNTVEDGYNDKLYIYDLETGVDFKYTEIFNNHSKYYIGNINGGTSNIWGDIISSRSADKFRTNIKKGENENFLNKEINATGNEFIQILFFGGGNSYGIIDSLNINIDNNYYTLKDAVEASKIKPLVSIYIGSNGDEYMNNNTTSIYNGGAAAGVFPNIFVTFMLEKGTHFNSVKFNSNNEFIPSDGLVIGMRNAILHLK